MILQTVKGSLLEFCSPENGCNTISHCVSADLALGKGIAKTIKDSYPEMMAKLKSYPHPSIGDCLGYTDPKTKRNIINLVTKERYFHKPTYDSMDLALRKFKDLLLSHNINTFAIPKIGCGLDKLDWDRVSYILEGVFYDFEGNCFVCVL